MFYKWKNCTLTALALGIALLFGGFTYAESSVLLNETQGARVYYLDSASSQSLIKTELALCDLPRIRGESVWFAHTENVKSLAEKIFQDYGAEIAFVEESDDVISYYGYARGLGKPIFVQGHAVNLHVAATEARCVVGTPIIFGGF